MEYDKLDETEQAIHHLIMAARLLNRAGGHDGSVRIIRECFDQILKEI